MSWPKETLQEVLRLYLDEGLTQQQIADKVGVSRAAVIRNLKKHADPAARKAIVHKNHSARSVQSNSTVYGELRNKCVDLFRNSDKTITAIAEELGTTASTVRRALRVYGGFDKVYLAAEIQRRSTAVLVAALKEKGCKEIFSNGRYNNCLSPEWMTRKYAHAAVGDHIRVVLENMGLSELPKGYVVHHVNNDSKDNRFENLVLMTRSEHTALHRTLQKCVTTILDKRSTLKWVEARRKGEGKHALEDIVLSAQECAAADNAAGMN